MTVFATAADAIADAIATGTCHVTAGDGPITIWDREVTHCAELATHVVGRRNAYMACDHHAHIARMWGSDVAELATEGK